MPRTNFGIYNYIASLYSENSASKAIRKTPKLELQEIQISYSEARIIQFILTLINAKNVLEIGVLAGYSTYMISQILPENGKLIAVEKDNDHFNLAKQNLAGLSNVDLRHGDGLEIMKTFSNAHFDAIFIDANKKGYSKYLDEAGRVLKKGGVIIFDNTLMYGEVYQSPKTELGVSLDEFNKYLAGNNAYESLIIPTDSGLTIARKK